MIDLGNRLLPSPVLCGLGARCLRLSGPQPVVHRIVTARALAIPPERDLVGGLRPRDLPSRRHPSYAASIFYRFRTFTLGIHGYLQASHNAAERALRSCVLMRKTSFGTHSEEGSRFIERMLTIAATLRQQDRNVVDYVTDAVERSFQGQSLPSLLPTQQFMRHTLPLAA